MLSALRPSVVRVSARAFSTSAPSSSIAKMILTGNLVADPLVKTNKNGKEFLVYKVATSDPYIKPAEGVEHVPTTSYHTVFAYGPAVEKLQGLKKGSLVQAEASFTTESQKVGEDAYTTNIFARHQRLTVLRRPAPREEDSASEASE